MPSAWFTTWLGAACAARISGATAMKMALLTSSYTPDKDHDFFNDVSANEVPATGGYTAGGQAVTVTPTTDLANDRVDFQIGAVTWPTATITARYAVIYDDTAGGAGADPVMFVIDFGGNVVSTGGNFVVNALTTPFRIQN